LASLGDIANTENGSVLKGSRKKRLTSWFHGGRDDRLPELGPRETEAMDHLWRSGELTAQDLQCRIGGEVSLNTIQSTLERLHRKGLVERRKHGRAFRYAATLTRAEVISRLLNDLARDVGGGDLASMISGFAGFVAGDDPDVEEELREIIRKSEQRRG